MKEINWPKLTADLISINQMPECNKRDLQIQEILNHLYPIDFDPDSKLCPFMSLVLKRFISFCSARKIKITSRQAQDLLPACQWGIYQNLRNYDPHCKDEKDRELEFFLIKGCINDMLKLYNQDHPARELLLLDRPVNNEDPDKAAIKDIMADINTMTPENIVAGLQRNQENIDKMFPEDLYSHEEQMLISLIILHISVNKDTIKWTLDKFKSYQALQDDPELFDTYEKGKALTHMLDSIMQSVINGNDHNISESGLMQFLCRELPTVQNTYCSDQGKNTVYTKNYISCCVSRIYRKWKQVQASTVLLPKVRNTVCSS